MVPKIGNVEGLAAAAAALVLAMDAVLFSVWRKTPKRGPAEELIELPAALWMACVGAAFVLALDIEGLANGANLKGAVLIRLGAPLLPPPLDSIAPISAL